MVGLHLPVVALRKLRPGGRLGRGPTMGQYARFQLASFRGRRVSVVGSQTACELAEPVQGPVISLSRQS